MHKRRNKIGQDAGNWGLRKMIFQCDYRTPDGLDDLTLCSDGEVLTRLFFARGRTATNAADGDVRPPACDLPVFRETRRWLDIYFGGRPPDFTPPYRMDGLTPFRDAVLRELLKIPFGETVTYGEIARILAKRRGVRCVSAQAVGGAVGWNPICLIVPCHRVMGAGGRPTGYGGGLENKLALLNLEWKFTEGRG